MSAGKGNKPLSCFSKVYKNGMTVKELKELIKDWPEQDCMGDPTEVWIETGRNLSSPVTCAGMLNHRIDNETGKEWSDFILESGAFDNMTN